MERVPDELVQQELPGFFAMHQVEEGLFGNNTIDPESHCEHIAGVPHGAPHATQEPWHDEGYRMFKLDICNRRIAHYQSMLAMPGLDKGVRAHAQRMHAEHLHEFEFLKEMGYI